MALDTDLDDQDQAEIFDEEMTDGDGNGETSDPYDRDRSVLDETARRGDADLEGDDDALDADEEDDETLADLDDAGDEDDLDGDDSDDGPLAVDAIPDYAADRDFPDKDDEDGVSAAADDDVEASDMGDMTNYAADRRVADFESDSLSDADLKDLDYMDDDREDRVRTLGGGAPDSDKAADAAETPVPAKPALRHEDKRLDEGLEETFPASDPVSAKHIT